MSHDESLAKTYHERRAERIGVDVPMSDQSLETFEQPIATPRVDAVQFPADSKTGHEVVRADFARTLERELWTVREEHISYINKYVELQSERDKLQDDVSTLKHVLKLEEEKILQWEARSKETMADLMRTVEERDKLRKALEKLLEGHCEPDGSP